MILQIKLKPGDKVLPESANMATSCREPLLETRTSILDEAGGDVGGRRFGSTLGADEESAKIRNFINRRTHCPAACCGLKLASGLEKNRRLKRWKATFQQISNNSFFKKHCPNTREKESQLEKEKEK